MSQEERLNASLYYDGTGGRRSVVLYGIYFIRYIF